MGASDGRIWQIERNGINAVPESERKGSVRDVFWIWFGANIAILGVVLGAVIMSYGLSLWQGVLVAVLGALSFALVGVLSIPGARTGVPTLTLARAAFGTYGNFLPTLLAWLNLVGWEVIVVVTATYALQSALEAVFGTASGMALLVVSFVVVTAVAFGVALLGHAAIARAQTVFSYVFGALTVAVYLLLLPKVDWHALLRMPAGSFTTGVLPALSIVVAGTGLSWVTTSADYTRYLPRRTAGRAVAGAVTWGSFLPVFALMLLGVLLSAALPKLVTAANPVAVIGAALPAWMSVPYLLCAVGGLVTADILDVYSSGLSLLAAGVRIPRYRTILVDAVLSIAGGLYILFVAQNFIGPFVSFLTLLAGVLAPWAGVFWIDSARRLAGGGYSLEDLYNGRRSHYGAVRWQAVLAFLVGVVASLLCTSSPLFTGPFANGIFRGSSIGFVLGLALSALLYAVLPERPRASMVRAEVTAPQAANGQRRAEGADPE